MVKIDDKNDERDSMKKHDAKTMRDFMKKTMRSMRQKTHTPYPHAKFDDFTDEGGGQNTHTMSHAKNDDFTDEGGEEDLGAKNDEGGEAKKTGHFSE